MKNIKLLLIIIVAITFQSTSSIAQIAKEKSYKLITEFGIGYPISLSDQQEDVATFLNLGYNKQVKDGLSIGTFAFAAFDVSGRGDVSGGIGLRLGKVINNHGATIDLGYTVKSKKYGLFPGPLVGINLPLSDKIALHARYKQFSTADLPGRKVIEVGINIGPHYVKRALLPVAGLLAIGSLLVLNAISGSR